MFNVIMRQIYHNTRAKRHIMTAWIRKLCDLDCWFIGSVNLNPLKWLLAFVMNYIVFFWKSTVCDLFLQSSCKMAFSQLTWALTLSNLLNISIISNQRLRCNSPRVLSTSFFSVFVVVFQIFNTFFCHTHTSSINFEDV